MNTSKFFLPSLILFCIFSILQHSDGVVSEHSPEISYGDFIPAIWAETKEDFLGYSGSVILDRTIYPVPWGSLDDFENIPDLEDANNINVFPIHKNSIVGNIDESTETIGTGDVTIHVRIDDADFNSSPSVIDSISYDLDNSTVGPIKISIFREGKTMVLAYAGGNTPNPTGVLDVGDNARGTNLDKIRQIGGIAETDLDSGIFEFDLTIRYTDGPSSKLCPPTTKYLGNDKIYGDTPLVRFDEEPRVNNFCILQDDILTVEYVDSKNSDGQIDEVKDSAAIVLMNGVLQTDHVVYVIGRDIVLTLIDPDLNLDSHINDEYDLDILGWNSHNANVTLGSLGNESTVFDPLHPNFIETGPSTGIFQNVIRMPLELNDVRLERGESIVLEYIDAGPTYADYVGQKFDESRNSIFTTNYGATVEFDQKIYTWTDKVYITINAPDHNSDSESIDKIGDDPKAAVNISTRGYKIDQYKLLETGVDTGIFVGEVTLTGFPHDADGNPETGDVYGFDTIPQTHTTNSADGFIESEEHDGISVSFEFSPDEFVIGSALIRWNIGDIQWDDFGYSHYGYGVVRVVDPDMNLNLEMVDVVRIKIWSDSDPSGTIMKLTETNFSTGVFEGSVLFDLEKESHRNLLNISDQDFVYVSYADYTLPPPYTKSDNLILTAKSAINPPDFDDDGVPNYLDECPSESETNNDFQDDDGCFDKSPDADGDGISDSYDFCPNESESFNNYEDWDGCHDVAPSVDDADDDGVKNSDDNCPDYGNRDQQDSDNDGIGDYCDDTPMGPADYDEDEILDYDDNCPKEWNPRQRDNDDNGIGDRCDGDADNFDFSINTDPTSMTIMPGKSVISNILVSLEGDDTKKISLSCYDASKNIKCEIKPDNLFPPSTALLSVHAAESIEPDQYTVIVTGFEERIKHSTIVIVNVEPHDNEPPKSVIKTIGPYEIDRPIMFSAADSYDPDGSIDDYQWEFGDGNSSNLRVLNHTYNLDGNYLVSLTVTDSNNGTSTDSINVEVKPSLISEVILVGLVPALLVAGILAIVRKLIKKKSTN